MLDLLFDTDLEGFFLGDLVTDGGISLGGGPGGVGTVTSVNGNAGPVVVLAPENIFGVAAPSASEDGQGLVWDDGTSSWVYAATATTHFANTNLTLDAARTHDLNNFALSILETNMGLQIAPAVASGSAYVRNTAGSLVGVSNATGPGITFAAGDDLQLNGSAGTSGHRLTSQGANSAPIWAEDTNLYTADGTVDAGTARLLNFDATSSLTFRGTAATAGAQTLLSLAAATTTAILQGANSGLTVGSQLNLNQTAAALTVLGGTDINLAFSATSELQISTSPGAAGQAICSQGASLPPVWGTPRVQPTATAVDLTATNAHDSIRVTTTGGDVTISLPVLANGKRITLHKVVASNGMIVAATGGTALIKTDGILDTSESFSVPYSTLTYEYNSVASTWFLVAATPI